MPKRWSIFKLDADKIKAGTFSVLFKKDMVGMVAKAYFKAANKGDYSLLYAMQKFVDIGIKSTGAIGEMSAKGFSADYQEGVDYRKTLKGNATVLGGNISIGYWGIASAFKIKMIPEEYRKPRMSSTETLVISGDLDVSTPSDYARDELMPFLKNGEQLILRNMSHEDIITEALKSPDLLSKYFDAGIVDKSSIIAIGTIDFKPKMKFGKVKIFVMGVVM
ncbi:hypothetical protein [Ferruginibacter sp.]|nr:hypothetical protein [Ferruginibacter sp.]